jgi:hypothetical protein
MHDRNQQRCDDSALQRESNAAWNARWHRFNQKGDCALTVSRSNNTQLGNVRSDRRRFDALCTAALIAGSAILNG